MEVGMKDRDLIIAILTEFYPDESRFLGEAIIEDVVDSVSLGNTVAASNIDLGSTITIVAAGAGLIKTLLEIYFMLKQKLGKNPTKDELANAAKIELDVQRNANIDNSALMDSVIAKLAG